MKAISLDQPQKFRLIDTAEPAAPGLGDALVKVHRVGICGTDYGGYLGKMPFFSYPRIPGHELGVEVLAVGEGVTNVQPGDRCSVEPYLNCQKCYACRRGHTNCCEHNKTLGVMCDGGLAERYVLPARKLHISRKLTFDQLALVETLAIGCHAVDRGAPEAGDNVLVVGAGPIGLSVIEFVKPVEGQAFHFGDTVQVEVKVTDDQPVDCTKVQLNYIVGHQTHGHPISSSTGCTGQFVTTVPSGHDPSEIRAVFAASYTDPGPGTDGEGALTGNAEITLNPTP